MKKDNHLFNLIAEFYFAGVTLLYLSLHIFLKFGLHKSSRLQQNFNTPLPIVSVVVAGRNESENIAACILSLSKIDYPHGLLEIILVNDNSTDDTLEIMKEKTKSFPFFKVINSEKNNSANLKGKANAIDTALKICKGEIIISTDADCTVSPEWVKQTVSYYYANTALVCGFTKIKTDKSLFSKMQCLDWMYLLTLASSSSGLKMILSCIGNNLSFSKSSYDKVGGYTEVDFSVTEDLALMRKLNAVKNYEIKYPVNKYCIVETLPCKDISELMSQKKRWFRGGLGVNSFGYLIGFALFSVNIILLTGFLYLNIKFYLLLIIIKMFSEILLLDKVLKIFELRNLYKYFIIFEIYFATYGLLLPLSFIKGKKINWKGREF